MGEFFKSWLMKPKIRETYKILPKAFCISLSLAIASLLAIITGCSPSYHPKTENRGVGKAQDIPPEVGMPTALQFEGRLFKLTSDYYCRKGDWPTSWGELLAFAGGELNQSNGATSDLEWLKLSTEPILASSRAIVLKVSYLTQSGVKRKASFIAPPRCDSGDEPTEHELQKVSVAGGGVTFRLPKGYRLINPKELKDRWKAPPYPDAGWEGEGNGVVIALMFSEVEVSNGDLVGLSEEMAEAYESSFPTIIWSAREERVVGGRPYIYQAFQSAAITSANRDELANSAIESVILAGVFNRRLFSITVTAPNRGGDLVASVARIVEGSLKVR
jgi:hypothetical protein